MIKLIGSLNSPLAYFLYSSNETRKLISTQEEVHNVEKYVR